MYIHTHTHTHTHIFPKKFLLISLQLMPPGNHRPAFCYYGLIFPILEFIINVNMPLVFFCVNLLLLNTMFHKFFYVVFIFVLISIDIPQFVYTFPS